MKKLELNHTFTAEAIKNLDGNLKEIDATQEIIMPAVALMPPGGLDFSSMEPRITLIQKLKKAINAKEAYVLLDKDNHNELVAALKMQKFVIADSNVFYYIKSIVDLPEVVIDVKQNKKAIRNKTA